MEFSLKQLPNFVPSEEDHFFMSAEECQLLYFAIQATPYDTVCPSVLLCTLLHHIPSHSNVIATSNSHQRL